MFPVDGIMLLKELKKRSPLTPVIMITASPTSAARIECMKNGAAAFLPKPFDLKQLQDLAQRLAHSDL
jgi:two-component system nitrogen regulation response regulator GlnG